MDIERLIGFVIASVIKIVNPQITGNSLLLKLQENLLNFFFIP
jgi:hypothetical protein